MMIYRNPSTALQPYVSCLWADEPLHPPPAGQSQREHVLPTGHMHLVFRFSDAPLRLFASEGDTRGWELGVAVVGGARDVFYVKDVSKPSATVGCMLRPGAALALFGVAAHEISGAHTRLDDLWGAAVAQIQMRLMAASTPQQRLAILEQALAARLSERCRLPTRWLHALQHFDANMPVAALVRSSGLSHRYFNALFLNAVGLTPKRYARVQRMQQAIRRIQMAPQTQGIEIALDAGYSDQAHWCREFRAMCGVTPTQYLERAPTQANHVPVPPGHPGQFSSRQVR